MQQNYVNDSRVGGNGNRWGNGGFINQCRGYDRIRTNAEKSFLHNRRPDVRRKMVIAQKAITLELGIMNDMTQSVENGEINERENKKCKVNDDNENCNKQINNYEVIGKMRRNRMYVKMFYDVMEKCWKSVPFHTRNPVSLRRWISFGMLSGKGFGLLIKSIE